MVQAVSCASLPTLDLTDERHFAACMLSLSILPRKHDDNVKGETRHRIYESCLNHLPRAQLDWAVQQWIKTEKWFPQVSDLLTLTRQWRRSDNSTRCKNAARRLLEGDSNTNAKSLQMSMRPLTQEDVDTWPSPWRKPLVDMGLKAGALIEDEDGKIIVNPEMAE